ncbi:MAG: NHL repeat-containing protein [Candidatus Hydrogenedentes bacterium]|nr:NHL repeat-containing protein [Candidatus Hydrogenedentota bacterium]
MSRLFTLVFLLLQIAIQASAADASSTIQFLQEWGGQGSAPGQLDAPVDIVITPADEIFITEHYNHRIQKFDTGGKFLSQFPVLSGPGGLALDAAGNLYISHFAAAAREKEDTIDCVSVYSPDGTLLRQWGKRGTGDGEFNCPGGLALSKDGRVYVADQTNHRVQVFDCDGNFLLKWGEYGNEPGQFGGKDRDYSRTGGPQFVALDAEGNVWTTEGMNCRIQKFSRDGEYLASWGDDKDAPGSFGGTFTGFKGTPVKLRGPLALKFDAQDNLWVSAVSGRIQQFNHDGAYIRGVVEGQGDTPSKFFAPHGIAFDSTGCLYVVDLYNHRIQKFALK